jgi:hypothetical protein
MAGSAGEDRAVEQPLEPSAGMPVPSLVEDAGVGSRPELESPPDSEPAAAAPPSFVAHLATEAELADWDTAAVLSPHGHVLQSLAWADASAARGTQTWPIAFDDGFRMLVLGRGPRNGEGNPAYASRGPIPEPDPRVTVQRALAAAELLAGQGIDALIVDGESEASSGLGELLAEAGFEPVEEQQPSRHRMDIRLGPVDAPNSDEKTIFGSFGATTRNAIRQADRHGLLVRRLDAGGGRSDDDWYAGAVEDFESVDLDDAAAADEMLRTFAAMLDASVGRAAAGVDAARHDWWHRALPAGHRLYLQAEHPQDGPIAGAAFYRHGDRLSYALAAEDPDRRRTYPGAGRLLMWRGIQLALDERRTSVDLGGVDTAAFRRRPDKGDPTYAGYQLRESFGARWVELTGAHRWPAHPMRVRAGRFLGRLAGLRR